MSVELQPGRTHRSEAMPIWRNLEGPQLQAALTDLEESLGNVHRCGRVHQQQRQFQGPSAVRNQARELEGGKPKWQRQIAGDSDAQPHRKRKDTPRLCLECNHIQEGASRVCGHREKMRVVSHPAINIYILDRHGVIGPSVSPFNNLVGRMW